MQRVPYALDTDTRRKTEIGMRFGKVPFLRAIGRLIAADRQGTVQSALSAPEG
jgi:hypothetical protein